MSSVFVCSVSSVFVFVSSDQSVSTSILAPIIGFFFWPSQHVIRFGQIKPYNIPIFVSSIIISSTIPTSGWSNYGMILKSTKITRKCIFFIPDVLLQSVKCNPMRYLGLLYTLHMRAAHNHISAHVPIVSLISIAFCNLNLQLSWQQSDKDGFRPAVKREGLPSVQKGGQGEGGIW